MKNRRFLRMRNGVNKSILFLLPIVALFLTILAACNFPGISDPDAVGPNEEVEGLPPGDSASSSGLGYEDSGGPSLSQGGLSGGETSSDSSEEGPHKPVGFINHGTYNATIRPWTWIPLGAGAQETPPGASTVSTASTSPGLWPNPSRFLTLPLGTYTWCIEWDEGDIDDDGKIDYFHYIDDHPLTLDESASDDLDMAVEVDISAPPSQAAVLKGTCGEMLVVSECIGNEIGTTARVAYPLESSNPPDVYAWANSAEYASPSGIQISYGGGTTPWYENRILWDKGDWVEATTSDDYSAIGVQAHGDGTIGWARVLFDGVEVWRGNTAVVWVPGRFAVYVEVRCFAPGTHTIRIEALGIDGGGGGMSVPVPYFGFRR